MADGLTLIKDRIVGFDRKPADQFQAHPLNWRKHPQRQREAVEASLRELGWVGVVIENVQTGNLIDGHERVWQALKAGNLEVPYIQVDLTPEEEALALATFDAITNMAETDAGKLDELLREVQTGEAALMELIAETAKAAGILAGEVDTNYSRKISAPIYTPKGDRPPVGDLYDDSRTRQLVTAIMEAEGLPDEVREFLTIAARRHTILRFDRIAEYYAHADAALQRLMEDSALVIIDFNRAIELGFVEMTEQIAKLAREEYGDA